MKKKIILTVCLATGLHCVELRIAPANFTWDMSVAKFMNVSFDMDANVLSLNEQHNNFGDSNLYYFYNADLYRSSTMDKMTTMMAYPITYDFPRFGSINDAIGEYTPIPVPSEYRVRGFDLDLGMGYDLVNNEDGFVGIGVNTGLSMPVMKMQNLIKDARMTYNLLDSTDTKIMTYKLGPSIQAGYNLMPDVSLYGSYSLGLQTGSIENDWIKSSMDVNGNYNILDLGLRYTPWHTHKEYDWVTFDPKLYFTLGYIDKKWNMDEVKADMFNVFNVSTYGMFNAQFTMNYFYVGAGYDF